MQGCAVLIQRSNWSATAGFPFPRYLMPAASSASRKAWVFVDSSPCLAAFSFFQIGHAPYMGNVAEESRASAVLTQGAIGRHKNSN